jgi:arginyl-tRNA synthetase
VTYQPVPFNLKLEDELGTPKEEENRKILTEILHQLERKQGEFFDLWKETRQWSIDLMEYVYDWAGVKFDQWYWESEVDSDSVKYVKQLFAEGKLIESQGAIGFDLTQEKLGFCLLLKSDGTGLYATKDIELAKRKFVDYKIEKSIYVVDMRQALHFQQVFRVLDILGFEQAKQCFHLQYNSVELPDGAMSSRKGNIVPLIQLVHKMEKMVKEKYLVRYQNEWTTSDIDLVATQVAQGAIKYGMIRMDGNKKIVFDIEEWLKLDGESGPFIQYANARIQSLCQKFDYQNRTSSTAKSTNSINSSNSALNPTGSNAAESQVQWNLLTHSSERKLIQKLLYFHSTVLASGLQYRPSLLCTYLYDLSKAFNLFYHECSIGQAETAELKTARLSLSYCVGQVLGKGLSLLGIPAPLKM